MLGPVGATVDGTARPVTALRQRSLLALLLLAANRTVRGDVLIDGIWGDAVPRHPDAALQIVVSRLRAALGPAASRLVSEPAGYRIEVGADELDHLRVREHAARARELRSRDDAAGAATALELALRCWTGEALSDLGDAPVYASARRELHELRLALYESRNDAYLELGRHVEILADIDAWARAEPWREKLRAQQMVALYRAGRQVDAIAVYDDLRRALQSDLGLAPSADIDALYMRILNHDTTLLPRHAGFATALPPWTSMTLPFVGRTPEERQICAHLRDVAGGTSRAVVVVGEAGIGKTRFALEMIKRVYDDAIFLTVDGDDTMHPGVQAIAGAAAEASEFLSDVELSLCLGRWPGDVADIVPKLRDRLPALPTAEPAEPAKRAARLRASVISWVGALSQRAPVVLVIDNLERAGPDLLMLIGALLVDEEPKRVLVLATARPSTPTNTPRHEQLLRSLDQRGVLQRIELQGLPSESIERLLTELTVPEASERAAHLAAMTGGNPFLVGELLRDQELPLAASDDIPGRIRSFVLGRVYELGKVEAELLCIAAAIGGEFDVALLTDLSRGTARSTEMLVDHAIEAGLVQLVRLGWFDFAHDIVRRVLADTIADDARADLSRRIATALERRGARAAVIATHWTLAGGDATRGKRLEWSVRAAEDAMRDLDLHAATRWFRAAADAADDAGARARLLVRLADARRQAGEASAADATREAFEIAQTLGDGDLRVDTAPHRSSV